MLYTANETGTDSLTPTLNWRLDNEANYATWFRLYVAPKNALESPVLDQWVMRTDVCGSMAGT